MQLILLLWAVVATLFWPDVHAAQGDAVAACEVPSMRSSIRTAVEQQLVLHGVPPPPELFKLLDNLKAATSPQANAIAAQIRSSISGHVIGVCEVNDPKLDEPMFITIFFGGFGVPQPSAYVLNFGLPGAIATIGDPPKG